MPPTSNPRRRRPVPTRAPLAVALTVAAALLTPAAPAAARNNFFWTGADTSTTPRDTNIAGNWLRGFAPDHTSYQNVLRFDSPASLDAFSVGVNSNGLRLNSLILGSTAWNYRFSGGPLTFGTDSAGNAPTLLSDSSAAMEFRTLRPRIAQTLTIGGTFGGVPSGGSLAAGSLTFYTGLTSLIDQATPTAPPIGLTMNGLGSLNFDNDSGSATGATSSLTGTLTLNAGRTQILRGSRMNVAGGFVGGAASAQSNASLLIDGANSRLATTGASAAVIGDLGTGGVTVQNGGTLAVGGSLTLGRAVGSTGGLSLIGTATATVGGALYVGHDGATGLSGGGATLSLSGAAASLTAGGDLVLGRGDTSRVTITKNGALTAAGTLRVPLISGTTAQEVITVGSARFAADAGGTLTVGAIADLAPGGVAHDIRLGDANARLVIGGATGTPAGLTATYSGRILGGGSVTFAKGGSTQQTFTAAGHNITGGLRIEGGSLTLTPGASFQTGGTVLIGYERGSNGTLILDGASLRMPNGLSIAVGYGDGFAAGDAVGRLEIKNGATLVPTTGSQGPTLVVGYQNGGRGSALIDGANTVIRLTNLDIAQRQGSVGELTISGGAQVEALNGTELGYLGFLPSPGGSGTLTVTGAGTRFRTPSILFGYLNTSSTNRLIVDDGATAVIQDLDLNQFQNASVRVGSTDTARAGGLLIVGALNDAFHSPTGGITLADASARLEITGARDPARLYLYGSVISGAGSVSRSGGGMQTLSAVHTYTGATTVSGGTLNITGSLAASSGVTVTGGALAGTGTLPAVSLGAAGTLAPGDANTDAGITAGAGTLTASSLVWASGGTLAYQLGDASSDLLLLSGAFARADETSGGYFFDFAGTQTLSEGGVFRLVSFATNGDAANGRPAFTASDFGHRNLPSGYRGAFSFGADAARGGFQALYFTVSSGAVPEPSALALLLASGAASFGLRRLTARRRPARRP